MILQDDDNVLLVISDEKRFFDDQAALFKELQRFKKTCVFALVKPANIVDKQLRKDGFNAGQLHYINATRDGCKGLSQCVEVETMQDLTSMSIEFTKALGKERCDAALLSPLSIMFSHVGGESVLKFVSILTQKARDKDVALVFLTQWNEKDNADLQDATLFMDRIVDLRKAA